MAKSSITLAPIALDDANSAAVAVAKAIATFEKAKTSFTESYLKALAPWKGSDGKYTLPLTAKQYDKQFAPTFKAEAARRKIADTTVGQYSSKLKTATLAILNNVASPVAGETFWKFCERAAPLVASAKLDDGTPVWDTIKVGRKAAAKGAKPGKSGGAAGAPTTGGGDVGSAGTASKSPELAAALILTKDNQSRAEKLVRALESFPAEFDKWVASILSEEEKRQTKQPKAA